MLTYLYVITLAFSVFAFLFYRAIYITNSRAARYKAYGNAVYKAVGEHFEELKEKEKRLKVDKGYGNVDDSEWKDEVINFINLVVAKRISARQVSAIKTVPGLNLEFYTFCANYIMDLLCYSKLPENDYIGVIEDIEIPGQNKLIPSRTAALHKAKQYVGRLAIVFVAVNASFYENAEAAEGFAPFDACNALIDEDGFTPHDSGYHAYYEGVDEFGCSTPYKDLGAEAMPNNIALYVTGVSELSANSVHLVLNVNVPKNASRDLKYFSNMCGKVVSSLVGQQAAKFSAEIIKGKPFSYVDGGYGFRLEKDIWPSGKGFEYRWAVAGAECNTVIELKLEH
ncbi:hypothetical protein, partial [Stutzerimonas kunmingensis]|uniref:hypothetical protein n=1 Tax=Stutzerimonas kunmingensis TaxID=1211807 RepID=UPI0028B22E3B